MINMLRIILCLLQILFLSSCEEFCEEKPLEILKGEKIFFSYPKNNPFYVSASGIWQVTSGHDGTLITNNESINYPHSVDITCDRNSDEKVCYLKETIIGPLTLSKAYYITTNENVLVLKTWDKDKIVATEDQGSSWCFFRILQIDLHTKEVLIKSILKDNRDTSCSSFKGQPMPIIHKLVDFSESPWDYFISLTKREKQKK